jgi:hypothetical protein
MWVAHGVGTVDPHTGVFWQWAGSLWGGMLGVEVVMMTELGEIPEVGRREQAIARLRQKSDFRTHLFVYSVVNGFLVVIWLATGAEFFWPMFPMLAWGVGLVFHAWDVYWRKPISEEQIRNEMEHIA